MKTATRTRSTRIHLVLASFAVGAVMAGSVWAAQVLQEDPFPHDEHEGLFPLCVGCHEGIPSSDVADFYPEAESCSGCHDGGDHKLVTWVGPTASQDNVAFDHAVHDSLTNLADDPDLACASCHAEPGGGRMSVSEELQLGTCFSCHAHEAREHYEDAECAVCHVPLTESGFALARIEALPLPVGHEADRFLSEEHGVAAASTSDSCATCHTVARCEACHVNADLPEIEALPRAPADMVLPIPTARYEEPSSHLDDGWFYEHAGQASLATCGSCHTSNDCLTCHVAEQPAVVATLVDRSTSVAPGVGLVTRQPESHESLFFLDVHSALAAGSSSSCATCHQESYCLECHDGPSVGGYHPVGFVARHSADAFGRNSECATCHSTQAFCRECHSEIGLTAFDRLGPDYHIGGPLWLIRHGQAARQNLESCASCHAQADCTTCHSTVGAFKVNPHSRDFDAERAFAKSPATCAACHIRNPLIGRDS